MLPLFYTSKQCSKMEKTNNNYFYLILIYKVFDNHYKIQNSKLERMVKYK